jgi:hypothetical protein
MYGEDNIAALMGFSHIRKGSNLQDIWTYFHSSRGKNLDACRRQIMACMNRWSYDCQIPINTSMYLKGTTIKAIMKLKFNPGEEVAHLSSADKGLSIMACHACTSTKTKRIREARRPCLQQRPPFSWMNYCTCQKGLCRPPQTIFGN